MIYKDFQDLKLSALGMGCMCLPVVGGNDAVVDEAAAEDGGLRHGQRRQLLRHRLGYHNGNSEIALGRPWPNIPGKILHCRQVPRLRPVQHAQGAGDF
ncbi:hypothetical protein [Oscillibacter sp.]|uniref:hypothetical protein n=1 Tax=Oscillibacter sp. TaxID=1945593 RepID=UPI00338D5B4F